VGKRYWVDVSRTANGNKRRSKPHVAYDGEKLIRIRSLLELADAEEIYIDSLFPEIYEDLLTLLRDGVKVLLLREAWKFKGARERLRIRKSDENDAFTLSRISRRHFMELSAKDMEMRIALAPLLAEYIKVKKRIKTLRQWLQDEHEETEAINNAIKALVRKEYRLIYSIIKEARKRLPLYSLVEERCGFSGASLAGLIFYVDFSRGFRKILSYVGKTPTSRKSKKFNHQARMFLNSLAISIIRNIRRDPKKSSEKYPIEVVKIAMDDQLTVRDKVKRIENKILKLIRRTYRETRHSVKEAKAVRAGELTNGQTPYEARSL